MTLKELFTGSFVISLKAVIPLLAVAVFLGAVPGVHAEGEPAPATSGSGITGSGETAPSPAPRPGFIEAPATPSVGAPESPEAPAPSAPATEKKVEPSAVTPPVSGAYVAPTPVTSIGSLGGDASAGSNQPIIVPRSGGLPTLDFTNKSPNWINASLSVAESYDSNVFLRSYKQDDFITRVSPVLGFNFQNQLLDWSLGSSLDYRYYARNTRTEDFSYALNTTGRINVYREYAYIVVSDRYSQTSQSNATDYNSLSANVNVTDQNVLRVNPRLEIPLTSRIKFNPQYSYTNYWYPSQSQQNRQSHQGAADFSYELSPRFSPFLGYSYTRMDGTLMQYNQQYPYIGFRYEDERFILKGSVGYSKTDLDRGDSTNDVVWDASLTYRLTSMSFTLSSSSDVDQSAYLNGTTLNQFRKAPQMVTNYSATFMREFRKAVLALSLYYRENDDSVTSDLLSRNFGTSGSLRHDLSARLTGTFDYRVERNDQRTYVYDPITHRIIYQLGYGLAYTFGKDWTVTGSYRYQNSSSPQEASYFSVYSYYNYADNRVMLEVRKVF
jgi:hypothetical protein